MEWGPWMGPAHLISLALGAVMILGIYFLLKNRNDKTKTAVLGVLSFSGLAAIIVNMAAWGSPLEYLPLHMCSINAMLLPFAVFSRNKVLGNLLLLWSLGAVLALVFNQGQADYEIMGVPFIIYYFPHVMEFGIPVLLFVYGLVKLDWRCIGSTLVITAVIYTGVHLFNVWFNSLGILGPTGEPLVVNYMYSLVPEIPILQLMYSVIPYPYWYMYVVFPVLALLLAIVYLPSALKERQLQKTK